MNTKDLDTLVDKLTRALLPSCEQLVGRHVDEIVEARLRSFLTEEVRAAIAARVREAVREGISVRVRVENEASDAEEA